MGIQLTAHNGAGAFAGGTGTMPLQGIAKVCLFLPCSQGPVSNVSIPLSAVGVDGTATASFVVNLTVTGSPWTTGTASVGTITRMGFAHGPASGTSSTAAASGVVRLVTPIFVSTNIGSFQIIPAFGALQLHLVPEPGTILLLASGLGALALAGRSRMQRRR